MQREKVLASKLFHLYYIIKSLIYIKSRGKTFQSLLGKSERPSAHQQRNDCAESYDKQLTAYIKNSEYLPGTVKNKCHFPSSSGNRERFFP